MKITVARSPAERQVDEHELELSEGATVAAALEAAGLPWPDADAGAGAGPGAVAWSVSVWGRKATAGQVLRDGDRVELCRGLRVDPKVARRERFKGQGARSAGLFARKRPGAKPGY